MPDEQVWAHSRSEVSGRRHGLADHLRGTSGLARRFAEPWGAGPLAGALGLLHDAGKAACAWQARLLEVEGTGERVGRPEHKRLGAKLLARPLSRGGGSVASAAALAVLGHHGGLTSLADLKAVRASLIEDEDRTLERLFALVPEARRIVEGSSLWPVAWQGDNRVAEIGVRMVFSALVDADHLDTAAHFRGRTRELRALPDMARLVRRFEHARGELLAERRSSAIDEIRAALYEEVVGQAHLPPGVFRLPAPTGSGKTITSAGFALHHAARHGHARVIVAVPFLTITEQNADVYRRLLGADTVLEHHSLVEFDTNSRLKLAAENWDAPFVVTTTVQLFDSLFGRRPARSRKLHRLANAVVVLDEVQALPVPLLCPILDALRVLVTHFGTTVVLASATQPVFEQVSPWSELGTHIRELVARPVELFGRLRRVEYQWRTNPRPTSAEIADEVARQPQALVVVNTIRQARQMFGLLRERSPHPVRHLSTRMCPAHRHHVLGEVRELLTGDTDERPVLLVSTQLIEAGVDVDFPVVFRALAPAEAIQQAAGRANREGRLDHGRVVVFDAADARVPGFYRVGVDVTRMYFGPDGRADPDDIETLTTYYRHLYASLNVDQNPRGQAIQAARMTMDYVAVAEGPFDPAGLRRRRELAFRMIDEESVPVVITDYEDRDRVVDLLAAAADPGRADRGVFRALRPYIAALPRQIAERIPEALCPVVAGQLRRWDGLYDPHLGIVEETEMETIW